MRAHFAREERVVLEKLQSKKTRERWERALGSRERKDSGDQVPGDVPAPKVSASSIFDVDSFKSALGADARTRLRAIMDDFGTDTARQFGATFDLHNPAVTDAINAQVNRLVGVEDTTYDAIKAALAKGEAAGEPMSKLADRVRQVFQSASASRAEMIARTEVIGAANTGKLLAAQQSSPIVQTKQWLATEDNRTCVECESLDGEERPLDQSFSDGTSAPPDHPNCRCTLLFGTEAPNHWADSPPGTGTGTGTGDGADTGDDADTGESVQKSALLPAMRMWKPRGITKAWSPGPGLRIATPVG